MRFEPAQWSDEAEAGLGASLGEDGQAIRAQVMAGEAVLWRAHRAWLVTREEASELVIVCFAGRGGRSMFRSLYARAQELGKSRIRFHTACPWLIEIVADWQPMALEYVIRIPVKGQDNG